MLGRVVRTWIRGQMAFELGKICADPGTGHDMVQGFPVNQTGFRNHASRAKLKADS